MSAGAHTPTPRLSLVYSHPSQQSEGERIMLSSSPQLTSFIERSAQLGLGAPEAVRLGLERALLLRDAQFLGYDVESASGLLLKAAAVARPAQPLSGEEARRVRRLSARRPASPADTAEGLTVSVYQQILTRARDVLPENALHAGAVEEMLAWEIAARLEGRPMGEWGLKTLALRKAGRRVA
jgi:hypothetical protein